MTEIEKMFENAWIKKAPDFNNCYPEMMKCHHCEHYKVIDEYTGKCLNEVYPDFTAEKQLELIKWLIRNKRLFIRKADYSSNFYMDATYNRGNGADNPKFESCLASLINDIWQDLTDQEKEEIRNILK